MGNRRRTDQVYHRPLQEGVTAQRGLVHVDDGMDCLVDDQGFLGNRRDTSLAARIEVAGSIDGVR
jgi:hypothetical protein